MNLLSYKTTFHFGPQVSWAQLGCDEAYCGVCDEIVAVQTVFGGSRNSIKDENSDAGCWIAMRCGHEWGGIYLGMMRELQED